MKLHIEKYYPIVLSSIAGGLWWKLSPSFPTDEKEFLAAALSLGAVLTGFIATAQAILMALSSDSVMRRIKSSGYINELVLYIGTALFSCMFFCAFNLLGFFLIAPNKHLPLFYSTAWIIIAFFAMLTFMRVTSIMLKILRSS